MALLTTPKDDPITIEASRLLFHILSIFPDYINVMITSNREKKQFERFFLEKFEKGSALGKPIYAQMILYLFPGMNLNPKKLKKLQNFVITFLEFFNGIDLFDEKIRELSIVFDIIISISIHTNDHEEDSYKQFLTDCYEIIEDLIDQQPDLTIPKEVMILFQ